MIENFSFTDATNLSGTLLLLYIAVKMTRFDMIIKAYSTIVKKLLKECPLFKDKITPCASSIIENNLKEVK